MLLVMTVDRIGTGMHPGFTKSAPSAWALGKMERVHAESPSPTSSPRTQKYYLLQQAYEHMTRDQDSLGKWAWNIRFVLGSSEKFTETNLKGHLLAKGGMCGILKIKLQ